MTPSHPAQPEPARATADAQIERWAELLAEMAQVHAQLEYLHLMLRISQAADRAPKQGTAD